jgi:hypothetical protein
MSHRLTLAPAATRWIALALCAVVVGVIVWQGAGRLGGGGQSPSPAARASAPVTSSYIAIATSIPATAGPSLVASPVATPTLRPATPDPTPTVHPSIRPTAAPTRTDRPWQQDVALVVAKNEGRVIVDSQGNVVLLAQDPAPPMYAAASSLDMSWSGLIQEPPRTGTDDKGNAYTDYNYSLFCGAGTGAVVLYYWQATHGAVTTKSGTFAEPVNLGANRYSSTYWSAQGSGGYGRGMILYLAEQEWPTPDQGLSWWAQPGIMTWSAHPPSTDVKNLIDAINWEASGRTNLSYFYIAVTASALTAAALDDHVHSDISMGVPVVIAARTADGTSSLPFWNVKSRSSAVNHFVTVVGYDDTDSTYAVMDTCGVTCNDQNTRAGVRNISKAALFALIEAESDNDGIMW